MSRERLYRLLGIYAKHQGSNSLVFLFPLQSCKTMGLVTRWSFVQGLRWSGLLISAVVKNAPASTGDLGSIPESGRCPRGRNGNPFCVHWVTRVGTIDPVWASFFDLQLFCPLELTEGHGGCSPDYTKWEPKRPLCLGAPQGPALQPQHEEKYFPFCHFSGDHGKKRLCTAPWILCVWLDSNELSYWCN